MKATFLVPPPLKSRRAAERVAGCAYGLYPVPNIFILYAATVLRGAGLEVRFRDCALEGLSGAAFVHYLREDNSDLYLFYTVNLSMETDEEAVRLIREARGTVFPVVFFGPAPTAFAARFCGPGVIVVRGEPEATLDELAQNRFEAA